MNAYRLYRFARPKGVNDWRPIVQSSMSQSPKEKDMFRVSLLTLTLCAALAASSPPAFSALEQALGLSADQSAAIQRVRADLREDARPTLELLRAAERELRGQQMADAPDAAAISMLEARIAGARDQLKSLRSQAAANARAVLTPDQTTAVEQLAQADAERELKRLAVQFNLLDRSEVAFPAEERPRVQQGDFRSDGRRR